MSEEDIEDEEEENKEDAELDNMAEGEEFGEEIDFDEDAWDDIAVDDDSDEEESEQEADNEELEEENDDEAYASDNNADDEEEKRKFSKSTVDSLFFNLRESESIADNDMIGRVWNEEDIDLMADIESDNEDEVKLKYFKNVFH